MVLPSTTLVITVASLVASANKDRTAIMIIIIVTSIMNIAISLISSSSIINLIVSVYYVHY